MRFAVAAIAIALIAAPAFAADAVVAHQGDMLRDVNSVRLSAIDSVNKDGSVGIIFDGRYITVPATSLSVVNGKLVTSLTKAQVSAMN